MVAPSTRRVTNGESLGRDLNFYTIRSTVSFLPTSGESESHDRLNTIITVIATRAQPVIVSVEPVVIETDPSDLPAATGAVDVFTLKFAIEHAKAWEGASPSLKDSLIDASVGFAADNISITFHDDL